MDEPVDGFTITHGEGTVQLSLSNRYGIGDIYEMDALDAARIGISLLQHSIDAMHEDQLP